MQSKCCALLAFALLTGCGMLHSKIGRNAVVTRHNVVVTVPDSSASLSVGNGNFEFWPDK